MGKTNFATMLKDENNKAKTLTENLGVAYETSGKYLLDFNFKLSQYRNMNVEDIKNDFAKVFFEDPMIATKFVFFVGDVRGGLGERKVFRACIDWLADNKPECVHSETSSRWRQMSSERLPVKWVVKLLSVLRSLVVVAFQLVSAPYANPNKAQLVSDSPKSSQQVLITPIAPFL